MFNKLLSLGILLGVSPIVVTSMLLIIIIDKKNPIFLQKRVGKNMKPFNIIKLRTKKNNQITKLGYYLRKYSIDELPQFINVLIGDMNIIGPRPLILEDYVNEQFKNRTFILPGITGYHQVFGKSNDPDNKLESDMYYINNQSFILDLIIFGQTIVNTILGKKIHY